MSKYEQLNEDIKNAMKAKNKEKLDVLRFLKSALKDVMINEKKEITDEIFIKVLSKEVKQRNESIKEYEAGNRKELAEKENKAVSIIESYLPEKLSTEEIEKIVKETLAENEITEKKDMGKAMKVLMQKLNGKADGKTINKIAMQFLL